MYAIVLTYDDRKYLTHLVIRSYNNLWPHNKFVFRIPYNDDSVKEYYEAICPNIELIKAKKPVKYSVQTLIEDIPDDEFVYWCFDDIYMHMVLKPGVITEIDKYIRKTENPPFDAIRLLLFKNEKMHKPGVNIGGLTFRQKRFNDIGFWFHQYIRCGVLKELFLNNRLSDNYTINELGQAKQYWPSFAHRVFVPPKNLCIMGETTRGKSRTINCTEALKEYKIEYPYKETRNVILNNRIITNIKTSVDRFKRGPS